MSDEATIRMKSSNYSLDEGISYEPGGVWEESYDDDIDVANLRRDLLCTIQERNATQGTDSDCYTCKIIKNINNH